MIASVWPVGAAVTVSTVRVADDRQRRLDFRCARFQRPETEAYPIARLTQNVDAEICPCFDQAAYLCRLHEAEGGRQCIRAHCVIRNNATRLFEGMGPEAFAIGETTDILFTAPSVLVPLPDNFGSGALRIPD
ncbi:hypothetical protein [Ensifer adhaerens]|uniref:hypothetical protein n=1 Tax=Ensifer adhaerens TaxID=106592 RepID=UPI00128EAF35|nr:hypothetical protein [Ensifer adhaerens]